MEVAPYTQLMHLGISKLAGYLIRGLHQVSVVYCVTR